MKIKLWNKDCLDVMKFMLDKSIDLVFTSPPFKDEDVIGDYWEVYDGWITEIQRVSKVSCIIHSATKLNIHIVKYPPKRTLVWGKGISNIAWRWNPMYVYESDGYKINKYIWCDSFGVESVSGKWKSHVYQDPLLLYQTVIRMLCKGGLKLVYDPFMGSGTTGQACKILNLDFIGSEIDKHNFEIAKKNIREQKMETIMTQSQTHATSETKRTSIARRT